MVVGDCPSDRVMTGDPGKIRIQETSPSETKPKYETYGETPRPPNVSLCGLEKFLGLIPQCI